MWKFSKTSFKLRTMRYKYKQLLNTSFIVLIIIFVVYQYTNNQSLDHSCKCKTSDLKMCESKNETEKHMEDFKKIEIIRRSIFDDVDDLKFLVNDKIKKLKVELERLNSTKIDTLDDFKEDFRNRTISIMAKVQSMIHNSNMENIKNASILAIHKNIQSEIFALQNPSNCSKARKLICQMKSSCGFGCQMHHLVYCLITSYFTNRTLLIDTKKFRYDKNGLETYFKNISTCSIDMAISKKSWNNPLDSKEFALEIPFLESVQMRQFPHLPPSIPKKIAQNLKLFNGNPLSWWIAQHMYYLFRYNDRFQIIVQDYERLIFDNNKPIVGLHIRRTDKINSEAHLYTVEEYMVHVEEYFQFHELLKSSEVSNKLRTVYLASDDPNVIDELSRKYPNYLFKSNRQSSKMGSVKDRYKAEAIQNLILDLHILSSCEYFVGTFSSQIGRTVHELMQTKFVDAYWRYRSLDGVYDFGGTNQPYKRAIYDHFPKQEANFIPKNENEIEIELKKGDLIQYYPEYLLVHQVNLWNGYTFGQNNRTGKSGVFPSYKVEEVIFEF